MEKKGSSPFARDVLYGYSALCIALFVVLHIALRNSLERYMSAHYVITAQHSDNIILDQQIAGRQATMSIALYL